VAAAGGPRALTDEQVCRARTLRAADTDVASLAATLRTSLPRHRLPDVDWVKRRPAGITPMVRPS